MTVNYVHFVAVRRKYMRIAPTSFSVRTHQVLSRREKTMQLLVRRRPVTVLIDRVKPAYILNWTDHGNNFSPPVNETTTSPL
jgi:hypothetical protein